MIVFCTVHVHAYMNTFVQGTDVNYLKPACVVVICDSFLAG